MATARSVTKVSGDILGGHKVQEMSLEVGSELDHSSVKKLKLR